MKGFSMKYYLALVITLFGFAVFMEFKPEPTRTTLATNQTCESSTYSCDVYKLTNEHRKTNGLQELSYSKAAESVAEARVKHLCETNTFTHDGWTGFFDFKYRKSGENLARNFVSPQGAFAGLKASPAHLKNIEDDWDALGVYTEPCNGRIITAQIFMKE